VFFDVLGKGFSSPNNQSNLSLQASFILNLLNVFFDLLDPLTHTRIKLSFVNDSLGITVDETGNTLSKSPQACL
jgi:hypothetical protein